MKVRATIALTTVLIISAMLLFGGIALVVSSVDSNIVSESYLNVLSRLKARSCLEEALLKVARNTSYIGVLQIPFDDGICSANVSNDPGNPNIKIIDITSNSEQFNYQEQKKVDISVYPPLVIN